MWKNNLVWASDENNKKTNEKDTRITFIAEKILINKNKTHDL